MAQVPGSGAAKAMLSINHSVDPEWKSALIRLGPPIMS